MGGPSVYCTSWVLIRIMGGLNMSQILHYKPGIVNKKMSAADFASLMYWTNMHIPQTCQTKQYCDIFKTIYISQNGIPIFFSKAK